MTMLEPRLLARFLCVLVLLVAAPLAPAQTWPAKPIKVVVPFAPGGATDIIGRLVGQKLGERLGQPVVIENRPGAGTTIGNAAVAKAPPDGYTLLFAPTPFVITQALYPTLPYDAEKEFAPIALLAVSPFILVVNDALPAKNVRELVALAKSKPGALTFCSAGSGSVPHLAGELFKLNAGVDIVHVPYKGGGPAITDLVGGQVNMMFATPIEVMQHVQSGRLRVLATTAAQRLPSLPDVPTMQEGGVPRFEVYASSACSRPQARRSPWSIASPPSSSASWPMRRCASALRSRARKPACSVRRHSPRFSRARNRSGPTW